MKKVTKILGLLLMLLVPFALSSCSDDDDDDSVVEISDWYSECTSVTGGGLSPQRCSQLQNTLNTDGDLELGPAYVWRNVNREQAIYYFNKQMDSLKEAFSYGMSGISGTLTIVVSLKNSSGKTAKTARLEVTSDGCMLK